jgi:hypothetical protein
MRKVHNGLIIRIQFTLLDFSSNFYPN